MADPVRIFVYAPLREDHLAQIRSVDPRVEAEAGRDQSRALAAAPDLEVLVGWRVPEPVIGAARRLRWFHSLAAGVDHMIEVLDPRVVITSSSGIHAVPISEHVFAMALMWVRSIHVAHRNQVTHTWDRPAAVGDELHGRTLGVLGLGEIGREIARLGRAFGMCIIGTKRTPEPVDGVERVYGPDDTDAVVAQSDVLVIALPLTAATRDLIGEAQFRLIKPGAFLVNIGRGEIVEEEAMVRALRDGRLGGAGLDVFAREPLPAGSPLWDMPNVIITPHVSGDSPRYLDRAVPLFVENLRRYLSGEPLHNLVDRERGY